VQRRKLTIIYLIHWLLVHNMIAVNQLAYLMDCKTYAHDNGLDFWIVNEMKYPLLASLAQDLLSAVHLKHTWNVCSQSVES